MTHSFRSLLLLTTVACGVEETGYLTGEGFFFTESEATDTRLLVAMPSAVTTTGGTLRVMAGQVPVGEVTLLEQGVALPLSADDQFTVTYDLGGATDTVSLSFSTSSSSPPELDSMGAPPPWIVATDDGLEFRPGSILGTPPYLVANETSGAALISEGTVPAPLDGQAGDLVCVSSVVDDAATTSLCGFAVPQ